MEFNPYNIGLMVIGLLAVSPIVFGYHWLEKNHPKIFSIVESIIIASFIILLVVVAIRGL